MKNFIVILLAISFNSTVLLADVVEPQKTVFPNGLTLIHQYSRDSEVIAIDLFVKAGSATENDSEAGLANFVQSLLYLGTTTRSQRQIAIQTESIGTTISSSCAEDYALISAVAFKKYFAELTDIFFDGLLNPTFPDQEIEKTRINLLAAIIARQDSIFNVSLDLLNAKLYGQEHPYHRPSLGFQKVIEQLSRQQLLAFYQKFYHPENMILVIVGDISPKNLKNLLAKYFPKINESITQRIAAGPCPSVLTHHAIKETQKETKFGQGYLMMGYAVPPVNSSDYPVLKIIATLLGGGMNSRLFITLREKHGLGYELNSFYPSRACGGEFVIYLGLKSQNIDQAYELIKKEIDLLKTTPVADTELGSIKKYLGGQYLLSRQTNQEIAFYLGFYELLQKGYTYDKTYLNELNQVTADDIKHVADRYFTDTNLTVIKLNPKSSSGGTK